MKNNASYDPCRCCHAPACTGSAVTRRAILTGAAGAAMLPVLPLRAGQTSAARQAPIRKAIKVQPVLVYDVPKRVEARSWRSWGGIQTEQAASEEKARIGREVAALASPGVEFLPLAAIKTAQEAAALAAGPQDLNIIYAAGGGLKIMETLAAPDKWSIMFVRHRSGPAYLWYEIASPRFLRKTVDEYGQPGMDSQDVVVDSQPELAWRINALSGLKNALGKRIVAIGGASGWGAGGRQAADFGRQIWKLDIQAVGYPELGEMIRKTRENGVLVKKAHADAEAYLKQKNVTLETSKQFVLNAFLLTEVFREVLDQAQTDAITINSCMGTIMPMSETTACLPLSILNDEGYMAFCESDFVVIPSGILLRYIANKPVFLNDPTYPHDGVVTIAHCTAPRKMDGDRYEPTRILTHFESDYGAAPKVEMRKGQRVTNLIPGFGGRNYVGFEGQVVDNPFMPICRAQVDVSIEGNCEKLAHDMVGFHWMTSYGSHLKECAYALKKNGVTLTTV
ncbi:MAG TPA: hypothetical protein VN442_12220 [Bryobacteraceae bacterium]|nr:hypothetical protein [Bryobacteraceae bacterium]